MVPVSSNTVSIDELSAIPVLDLHTLSQIDNVDDGKRGLMKELFGMFETDMPVRLSALKAAIESNDMNKVRELSHAAKGSSGTIGAMRTRAASAMIEAHSKGNQTEATLDELFDHLQNAFADACEALREYIGQR